MGSFKTGGSCRADGLVATISKGILCLATWKIYTARSGEIQERRISPLEEYLIEQGDRERMQLESMTRFIEGRLFLKVNRGKSFVARIDQGVKYLGYGFYLGKGEVRLRVHPKSVAKLKAKVSLILARSNGWSLDYRRYRLRCLVNGWVGYFRLADMRSLLAEMDGWCRRKVRCVYWKCWKKTRTKLKALTRLGIGRGLAWAVGEHEQVLLARGGQLDSRPCARQSQAGRTRVVLLPKAVPRSEVLRLGTAVYRTVCTVVCEDGASTNDAPPTRFASIARRDKPQFISH